jgi:hypothetical protein
LPGLAGVIDDRTGRGFVHVVRSSESDRSVTACRLSSPEPDSGFGHGTFGA